jgi:DNA-binding NtrC family response regulator
LETRAIKERLLREDLDYPLKAVCIQTPPLRAIAEDIPVIAKHFLAMHCAVAHRPAKEFAPTAIERLKKLLLAGKRAASGK